MIFSKSNLNIPELRQRKKVELTILSILLSSLNCDKSAFLPYKLDEIKKLPKDFIASEETILNSTDTTDEIEKATTSEIKKDTGNISTDKNKNSNSPYSNPRKFLSIPFILSILIYTFSVCIGISVGSVSLPKHTTTLDNEYNIVDNEIKTMKLQEEFYKQQTDVLKQTKRALNQVYTDLKSIDIRGILGEIRSYPEGIQAIYYLIDATQIDSIVNAIKSNYSVVSVSQTDSIKIDDNILTVYTITLK